MSYIALYRKFRPKTFDEVKGQEQIVTILKNQMKAGRIGHAYIFSGTRGTGKTSIAKIFAKAVNCESPVAGNPCGTCPTCKRIAEGANLNVIEIDAASSNGVDNIREIIDEVQYSPTEGKYKVYIIDEVHMLSGGAFNALLKTLEEPPSYVIFILATTEIHKIPVTILSRCQRYDFRRISAETIADRLKELLHEEGETFEEEAVDFIARKGDGSMRDALSLLDQCLSFYFGEKLTYEHALQVLGAVDVDTFQRLFSSIRKGEVAEGLDLIHEVAKAGLDFGQFTMDFTWFFRNLLLLKVSKEAGRRMDVAREKLDAMEASVKDVSENELLRYIRVFSKLSQDIKYAAKKRAELEIAVIKLCKPEMERNDEALYERIIKLEQRMEEGKFVLKPETSEALPLKKEEEPEIKKVPKALPEEIKKIAAEFPRILSDASFQKMLSGLLKESLPYYEEESGVLVIAVEDPLTRDMLVKEENLLKIKNAIIGTTGVEVPVKVKVRAEAKQNGDVEAIRGLDLIAPSLVSFTD